MGKEDILQNVKKLMEVEDVAELIRSTKGSVYGMVFQKLIPYYKIGKRVRFDPAEIADWLKNQRIPAKEGK